LGGAAKFHDGVPMGVEHLGVQYRCICGTARIQRQFLVDVRKAAGGAVRQECEELHVEQVTPTAPRFPDALGRTVRRLRGIVGTAQGAAGMERIECVDQCRGAARTRRKRQCGLPQAEDPVFAEG